MPVGSGNVVSVGEAFVIETMKQLAGDFAVLDLGSAHTAGILKKLPELNAITIIEIDALQGEDSGPAAPANRISLRKAVAGSAGKRVFKQRKFPQASSILEPKWELVKAYGLQDYFTQVSARELDCDTIGSLLRQSGVKRVDLFKTDLEGMDYEVLKSAPEFVGEALCVQSELRFQPFYEGEPSFHEVAAYLSGLGMELVALRPAVWKYATPNRAIERDGRVVWADTIFFMGASAITARFGADTWKPFAKQILLARLLELSNFAEHLFEEASARFPEVVRRELAAFVRPSFSLSRFVVAQINALPGGWMAVGAARRLFRCGYGATAVFKDPMVTAADLP